MRNHHNYKEIVSHNTFPQQEGGYLWKVHIFVVTKLNQDILDDLIRFVYDGIDRRNLLEYSRFEIESTPNHRIKITFNKL